ncbi:MAG: GAF domain-containing sensor histidine kinase [Chloroflexota bacterium]|nr:GAF domain-containing sensor histidine kinase [Chloroflexota bacterium]
MKANARASWPGASRPVPAVRSRDLTGLIRRFPERLRERRFWQVQALVLVATAPHYVIETLGFTNPFETLHGLAITLYIIPLLYAALSYGWEGAVMTALWAAALTSPSTWIWHRSELHWFTELGQLVVTLPVGILVAWRVDLETKQRRRAEKTSASLRLLNEVGQILSHSLEVEQKIPQVLHCLLSGLSLQSAWLCLEPESDGGGLVTMAEASDTRSSPPVELAQALHRRLASQQEPAVVDGPTVAVPLLGETGTLGSLGATVPDGEMLSEEQVALLTTVARAVRVALENARLYRQRQESLQSYARQMTQAQEEERLRIARELHDETAQELVHVVRKLERLRGIADAGLTQPIDELLNLTRNTVQAVRRFSRDLRPFVLDDLGLLAGIEMLVEDTNDRLPGGARLQVTGKPRRVDGPVELALFRIAQEALRNVEKHSRATSATVHLNFADDGIHLSVVDDGLGFAPPKDVSNLAHAGKLGLVGMKERAELVGGFFEVCSAPGKGARVTVTVTRNEEPSGRRQVCP